MGVENMNIEMECFSLEDCAPVQVRGAEHKRPRPIRETAWSLTARRPRFEYAGVWACRAYFAGSGIVAAWDANQLAEEVAESAAYDVAGFVRREIKRPSGAEMKSESVEF